FFFFSSRRRHTRCYRDWSSDVCSSDLVGDDQHALASGDRVGKQSRGALGVHELGRRNEAGERVLELAAPADPARGTDASKYRMQALAHELVVHAQGNPAGGDL